MYILSRCPTNLYYLYFKIRNKTTFNIQFTLSLNVYKTRINHCYISEVNNFVQYTFHIISRFKYVKR